MNDSHKRPNILDNMHPIETGTYIIPTNEIDRLYQKISQCLINRSPGAIIYGRPRLGKTRAIKYLQTILPLEFEEISTYFIMCRRYKNPNENTFFEDVLTGVGHALPHNGKACHKRERLFKFLIEEAVIKKSNRIVFFIDDAQRLSEIQYDWLMDINNELDNYGISFTVFLFGQNELVHQRSVFVELGKHQIIGRFMVQHHQFNGVSKKNDLKECLNGCDENCEFPAGSNYSFTRYYFPNQFKEGFRLSNFSDELYSAFKELRSESGIKEKIEIPMQYITLTVDYALKEFGIDGQNLYQIDLENWREAIISSGYIEAELYGNIQMKLSSKKN
ncbi:ATP-binding protein [Alkalihalobacillus sp. 1P02AB]|uniref:ATP-binding protein n=1 Tax=Alkalihalobacillus sp. 1P02AB TaxID=3132260 RepID=UPI0039A4D37B